MSRSFSGFVYKVKKHWDWRRLKRNFKWFLTADISKELYELKDEAVEDSIYEFEEACGVLKRLDILPAHETLDLLAKTPKSFARFGDGEIAIMKGENTAFQDYNEKLACKMRDILSKKRDNLYVGLNRSYFQTPFIYAERNHQFYRMYGTKLRRFFIQECDQENLYLDAACFGAYFRYKDDFDFEGHYSRMLNLFADRKLAIVCGEGVLQNIENDVFQLAKEKTVLEAPLVNAFSRYDTIINCINSKVDTDTTVCLMLGQTATALSGDLADQGYIAWDIGHIAQDYDAYMRGIEKTESNMDAFWGAGTDYSSKKRN